MATRKTVQKKKSATHRTHRAHRAASALPLEKTGEIQPAFPVPGDQDCTGQITPLAANGTHSLPAGGVIVSVRLVIGAAVHVGTIDNTVGAGNWRATFPGVTIDPNIPMAIIVTAVCPDGSRELIIPFRHVPVPVDTTAPTSDLTQIGSLNLLLVFSEDMGPTAFDPASYALTKSDSTVIAITITQLSPQVALLNLNTALEAAETYTLELLDVRDEAGNAIVGGDHTFTAT